MASASRVLFRSLFLLYTVGLLCWLLLGLLPTLVQTVPAVHHELVELAAGTGAVARDATRVLSVDPMMPTVPGWQAVLQYGFSTLNLALGLLLFIRRAGELVPRLLAFALLRTAATFNGPSHRVFHITGNPWPIAVLHFSFHVISGVCYLWAVVLFPNGHCPAVLDRLPGPAWLRSSVVTAVAVLICWRSSFLDHPVFFVVFFGIVVAMAGSAAQVLRVRDPASTELERRTARLLIAALLPALVISFGWVGARVVSWWLRGPWFAEVAITAQNAFPVVFALVPLVLCFGIVRYRWWNIDRLLSRVLVYGAIGVVTALVYLIAVVGIGRIVGAGLWWSVLALSATATAFEPLRRIAETWANRVVYGQVKSPAQALRALADGLEQLTPAGGLAQVEIITGQGTRAQSATIWVIDAGHLVQPTGRPENLVAFPAAERSPAAAAEVLGVDLCWPISHLDQQLGFLAVQVSPETTLTAADRALIGDIADHAGLLLQNALLGVRLAREAAELANTALLLRNTRRRSVAAQDEERRRLERDLHDGAQQALVAALIGVRTLRPGPNARSDVAALTEVLATAQLWLTELTGGDRPAVLVRDGLAGALQLAAGLARHSGLQVRSTVHGAAIPAGRQSADLTVDSAREAETAVYFCCCEALQNVAKYAQASQVNIDIFLDSVEIRFAVTDDGHGFDATVALGESGGIAQLTHRLALLGGVLSVESAAGRGTRLRGSVPLGSGVGS